MPLMAKVECAQGGSHFTSYPLLLHKKSNQL